MFPKSCAAKGISIYLAWMLLSWTSKAVPRWKGRSQMNGMRLPAGAASVNGTGTVYRKPVVVVVAVVVAVVALIPVEEARVLLVEEA